MKNSSLQQKKLESTYQKPVNIAEFGHNPDSLSDKGQLHALISLRSLIDKEALTADIFKRLKASENLSASLDWLKEYEVSPKLESFKTLLISGGDDTNAV